PGAAEHLGRRTGDGDLPRVAGGRAAGPARRRLGRRRQLVPEGLERDRAAGDAGDLLPARHRPDQLAAALHAAVHHLARRRRAGAVADVLLDAAVPSGVRLLQHGPRHRHGLGALPGDPAPELRHLPDLRLGALRRRGEKVVATGEIAYTQPRVRGRSGGEVVLSVVKHVALLTIGITFLIPFWWM